MTAQDPGNLSAAVSDFRRARRRAALQSIMARVKGKSDTLLSFDEISHMIKIQGAKNHYLADIPIDSIVGSVGRYADFNRKFSPLKNSDLGRWSRVKAVTERTGLPPIEVYKISDIYFVVDGNHRVSVARQNNSTNIEAYVMELKSNIDLSPNDDYEDVLMKAERTQFIEDTKIDKLAPEIELNLTMPGRYREIFKHIEVHRYYLGIEENREISLGAALISWIYNIYLPVVQVIRKLGVLRDFPGRSEADLYLWIRRHQVELEGVLKWTVDIDKVVINLASESGSNLFRKLKRRSIKFMKSLTPDKFDSGPAAGNWRTNRAPLPKDKLFSSILVPIGHTDSRWKALDQAIPVALHEEALLRALHVVKYDRDFDSEQSRRLSQEFSERCHKAGIEGQFVVEKGEVVDAIVRRAAWNDMVIINLRYPPGPNIRSRFRSGFHQLVQRCPRPVLAVPNVTAQLERILLAYDDSPKSKEALYLTSYLAQSWDAEVVIVGPKKGVRSEKVMRKALNYLYQGDIQPKVVKPRGKPRDDLLNAAKEFDVDLIVMGGYSQSPLLNIFMGSTVDSILRDFKKPVLISR